jgi:hypothetical protein
LAHGALELDDLRARTGLTIDGLEVLNALADLVAEFVELFCRVLGLRKVLMTSAALDLYGKLDAFEPMLFLLMQVPKSIVQQVGYKGCLPLHLVLIVHVNIATINHDDVVSLVIVG